MRTSFSKLILCGGALTLTLLGGAPAASGAPRAPVVERLDAATEAEERAVEAFWTVERMREAERQTAARSQGGMRAAPPDSWGTAWPRRTSQAIGKLFFSLPGRDDLLGVCSGAVVSSANRSVVATAAHCLHLTKDGGAHLNLYFVPAYDHEMDTYADTGWATKAAYVRAEWLEGDQLNNLQYDYGFLALNDRDGKRVADVTGAHGVQFDAPLPASVLAAGYPAVHPFDGESLQYCGGVPKTAAQAFITSGPGTHDNFILAPCGLTQGASGGPWITGYDEVTDLGTVVAVSSVGGMNVVVGRPLKAGAQPLFDAAQAA